ncbi:MAG: DNA adenine methylase [Anaerolineae bacterium]|nr:DNA adenine methylase [Anaerolineae bacterium]
MAPASTNRALTAKPFLKWAGGKRQLLPQIQAAFPDALKTGQIKRYIEPFIGSGAVFFEVANHFPIEEFIIADINPELILVYRTIQRDVEALIEHLAGIQENFFGLSEAGKKSFFYQVRARFNQTLPKINFASFEANWVERSAQIIFLNRTCFNGLFRVNSKGEFNVPFGRYKKPKICDAENLRAVSQRLKPAKIRHGDFELCLSQADASTFVYFDPPYRPISKTASFTAYSATVFDDAAQKRLAALFRRLDRRGARLMMSNSDPQNENGSDNFFDDLYQGFQIRRVKANRMINSKSDKRGAINELIITNYKPG